MRTKSSLAVMVLVLLFYAGLIGVKGVALLASGSLVPQVLGVALLVLPLLGLYVVWREIDFGRRTAVLARTLEAEGGLPVDDLPRRPSRPGGPGGGRRDVRHHARGDRGEPWGVAGVVPARPKPYDAAGDRTRARGAARRALALHG